jgi:hypothetical protein
VLKNVFKRGPLACFSLALPLSLSASVFAADAPKPAGLTSGIQQADMDPSVRAQDDLFTNANGTWLKNTPIPDDKAWYFCRPPPSPPTGKKERRAIYTPASWTPPPSSNAASLR